MNTELFYKELYKDYRLVRLYKYQWPMAYEPIATAHWLDTIDDIARDADKALRTIRIDPEIDMELREILINIPSRIRMVANHMNIESYQG